MSMAKQDNYKKERTETALSFHFSDFGMRGYISMAVSYTHLDVYKRQVHSIAFPAISTGVYGYPLEDATEIAVKTVAQWLERNAMGIMLFGKVQRIAVAVRQLRGILCCAGINRAYRCLLYTSRCV